MVNGIKFRAWDVKKKKMIYMGVETKIVLSETEWEFSQKNEMDEFEDQSVFGSSGSSLMQFTGLKDKNRKEIYEGDILKWRDYGKRSYRIYLVCWSEEEACIYLETIKDTSRNIVHDDRIYRTDTESEVIGNKFENPELLK